MTQFLTETAGSWLDSGKINVYFDWPDMTSLSSASSAQVTVWNSDTRSLIYNSERLDIRPRAFPKVRMRLSRTGKMALILDRDILLFQIP